MVLRHTGGGSGCVEDLRERESYMGRWRNSQIGVVRDTGVAEDAGSLMGW